MLQGFVETQLKGHFANGSTFKQVEIDTGVAEYRGEDKGKQYRCGYNHQYKLTNGATA